MIVVREQFRLFWEPSLVGPVIVRGHDMAAFSDVIAVLLPGLSKSAAADAGFVTSGEGWIASGEELVLVEHDLRPCAWWVASVSAATEDLPYDRQVFDFDSPAFGFVVDSSAYMRARMST